MCDPRPVVLPCILLEYQRYLCLQRKSLSVWILRVPTPPSRLAGAMLITSLLIQDNDHDVSVPCKTVADYASYVGANCCGSDYTMSKGVSGQAFSPDGWNVNLAYANCNHASDADVPSEFVEPYVNGDCTD